jgi:hypothetical protein
MENNCFLSNLGMSEKRGWLDKRSRKFIRRWQPRFFILKNRILEYYHLASDHGPAFTANFDKVAVDLSFLNSGKIPLIVLSFSNSERKLKLRAHNEKDFFEWIEALNKHISDSKEFKFENDSILSKEAF